MTIIICYRSLVKTSTVQINTLCMLILNIIDNCLACDCGVSRVLIMTYHRFF